MDTIELILSLQDKIVEIYKQENLIPLRGENDNYKIVGKELLLWFHDVTRLNGLKYELGTTYFDLQNDLLFCSDEMIYFTAHLFLYKPYLNNPLDDGYIFNGMELFPNKQNIPAKRYNMFNDIMYQKTYNYWDRIGDLIASFFPNIISANRVFFPSAVEVIPCEFHQSPNYQWLKYFKENEYKEMNSLRKQVVHYKTTDTDFRQKHLQIPNNREAMEKLQSIREDLPDYFKKQIEYSITGFEKTLLLLEEFNNVLYSSC